MTRKRQKNRIANGDRFFQMHVWFLQSEAWRATNVYERSLYFELKQRYNGTNNGEIPLSHREAQAALNCSDKPIKAAFRGLIEKGFIRAAQIGTFHWKQGGGPGGRSTRWILTEYPVDVPLRSSIAEKSFMRWKPEPQKKARCDVGIPMVGREHTISHGMVGREHTINAKVYAGSTR